MKTLSTRQIEKGLRLLGFEKRSGRGRRDGHEDWVHKSGVKVNPPLRKKELHIRTLYALTEALEGARICCRRDFYKLCMSV